MLPEEMYHVDDSCVPEILLAYADGIEEHIKTNCELTIVRMNSHDVRSQAIQAFCPHFVVQSQTKFLVFIVGAECLEFIDYTKRQNREWPSCDRDTELLDPNICHVCSLDYSDPNLLQQILNIINTFFGDES